ncbi:hypothetical protein [Sinanaerobacter chloroacetimidivorans]|uniref:Prophage pi2 protein 38 n=1 Tax=Sinanaerobacter chloroacetimidivorans TaxID=2818044 RepID=A0A8J8B2T2_9FIRM|nr:hypothetical protein [Sinanaerobacter chloroacetimidivorans]MBR0599047.1 hypothetical protein [Sinanaerobacter chloroacetimidivorans]
MTQPEFYNLIQSAGYPVVYHSFKASEEDPTKPPYIIYLITGSNNIGADNKVKVKINKYRVELYTSKKDLEAEQSLENVFDNASIFYDKVEVYIDTESMLQIIYEVEI